MIRVLIIKESENDILSSREARNHIKDCLNYKLSNKCGK
jgi:hypothetical protein